MNKKNLIISLCSVVLLGGIGAGVFYSINNTVATADAVIESEKVAVNAQDNGKVKDLFVKPNQNVSTGQLLAEIEVEQQISAEAVKKDSIEVSKRNLQEAEENHTNFAMMYKDGVISQQEYDESLEKLESARDAFKTAQFKTPVKPSVTTITKRVYSPKDGTVSINFVDKGENAVKNNPIVLLDTDNPKITAYFNPKFKDDLHVGAFVNIKSAKYKGKVFEGMIEKISPEPEMHVDKKSQVIPVTIVFKSNMSGYVFDKDQTLSVSLKK